MKRIRMATTAATAIGTLMLTGLPVLADAGHHPRTSAGELAETQTDRPAGATTPGMMGQGATPGMMGQGATPGMMGQGTAPGMMGQGMGPGMMGPGMGMMEPGRFDARLADVIEAHIGITEEQKPAWQAYVDAVEAGTELMRSQYQTMRQAYAGDQTAEERRALMNEMHSSMMAAFDDIQTARAQLFDVLSDAQKKDAHALLLHGPMAGMGMGPGMMMGQHMGSGM